MARGRRVRLRQPEVQRRQPRLGAEANQRQQQDRGGRPALGGKDQGGPAGAREIQVSSRLASQQHEEREQAGGAQMGGDQVDPSGATDLWPLVFMDDQEERGDRHQLPGDQKQHGIARGDHHDHGGEQEVVQQPGNGPARWGAVGAQVAVTIEGSGQADEDDRTEKEGGEGVEFQGEGSPWHGPGGGGRGDRARSDDPHRGGQAQSGGSQGRGTDECSRGSRTAR